METVFEFVSEPGKCRGNIIKVEKTTLGCAKLSSSWGYVRKLRSSFIKKMFVVAFDLSKK